MSETPIHTLEDELELAKLRADNKRLRAVLERVLENIANKKVPRQNIAGPIRAALDVGLPRAEDVRGILAHEETTS